MSTDYYLVHYHDLNRGGNGGSYTLHKTADEAVSYALKEYNDFTEHESLYCTEDKCMLELPIEEQKLTLLTTLNSTGEAIYPTGSCLDSFDIMRIVKLSV